MPDRARRYRVFATVDPAPRSRSATDLSKVLSGSIALALLAAAAVPRAGFERSLIRFVTSPPDVVDGVWRLLPDIVVVVAVALVLAAVITRRVMVVVEALVATAMAGVVTAALTRIVLGSWPELQSFVRVVAGLSEFPTARLALSATIIAAIAPHLSAPLRRTAHWTIGLAAFGLAAVGTATPTSALAALVVASVSAAASRLLLGTTRSRPSLAEVAAALETLGVEATNVTAAVVQSTGRFTVDAVAGDGSSLVVKVYGRDATDTQFLRTLGRRIWLRGPVRSVPVGRHQQVEREAFLTLFASQAGVRTHGVVAAGLTPGGDAVLVLTPVGTPLETAPERWDESTARALWSMIASLHERGISHGRIDDRHVAFDAKSGDLGLVDFHGATLAPAPELERTDHAQALVTTALAIGIDAAVAVAIEAIGTDGLDAALPMVQPAVLTHRQRTEIEAADFDLEALRTSSVAATGGEMPALLKLRRISWKSLIQVALMLVAFSALSAAFGGFDLHLLATQVRSGTWWLMALGLVLIQVARLGSAISTVGASPTPMALGPVYILQFALNYIGIAVPGSAARFAVNVRFLQRQGHAPGAALAVSGLDSVWWFVVQIGVVVGILVATPLSLDVDLGANASDGVVRIVTIVVGLAVLALVALMAVPKWRQPVWAWIRQILHEAREASRGSATPRRLGMLLGGNFATEVGLALALGAFARSLGYSVGLVELLFINVSVSLLAGLLPVPGGIGLVEGGLTLGLARAGLPEETAFAVALLYRMSAFYLPPLWGFFALRWLERREFL